MSLWVDLDMDSKVAEVLEVEARVPGHHLGRPFFTPYQIAIMLEERFPEECRKIGEPVGGKGVGQQHSLAQYVARQLSCRIRDENIRNIEGGFLSRMNLQALELEQNGETVRASAIQSYDLSLFRLRSQENVDSA